MSHADQIAAIQWCRRMQIAALEMMRSGDCCRGVIQFLEDSVAEEIEIEYGAELRENARKTG